MKQIWPDYSYSPTTNVLTLTGLNIDRDQLLLVAAPERGRIMYNFADSAVTASAYTAGANTALTLVASTAGLTTTASLVIYYDDQLQSTAITISNFPATQPVSIASVTIGSLPNVKIQGFNGAGGGQYLDVGVTEQGSLAVVLDEALPAGTAQIGSVTASISNSVTISSLPAISGTVTANLTLDAFTNTQAGIASDDGGVEPSLGIQLGYYDDGYKTVKPSQPLPISGTVTVGNSVTIGSLPAISGTVTANVPDLALVVGENQNTPNPAHGIQIGYLSDISGTFVNVSDDTSGYQQLPIKGTVTANTFAVQGTAVTTSNFTSTTASTVLASFNATREVLTIFNEGAGNLHICAGATCTTIAYQVRLSSGDYYEVPNHQTTITHSAVFATAGTARVTQVS